MHSRFHRLQVPYCFSVILSTSLLISLIFAPGFQITSVLHSLSLSTSRIMLLSISTCCCCSIFSLCMSVIIFLFNSKFSFMTLNTHSFSCLDLPSKYLLFPFVFPPYQSKHLFHICHICEDITTGFTGPHTTNSDSQGICVCFYTSRMKQARAYYTTIHIFSFLPPLFTVLTLITFGCHIWIYTHVFRPRRG